MNPVGEVIAVRRLFLAGEPEREILVKLSIPQRNIHGNDFSCAVQITGIGDLGIETIAGVDAFQALQLAMQFIGRVLSSFNREQDNRLSWPYGDTGDLGFPPEEENPLYLLDQSPFQSNTSRLRLIRLQGTRQNSSVFDVADELLD